MEDKIQEFITYKKEIENKSIVKRLLPEVIEGVEFQKVLTLESFTFNDMSKTIYVEYRLDYFNSEGNNISKLFNINRESFYMSERDMLSDRDPITFKPILLPLYNEDGTPILDEKDEQIYKPKMVTAMKLLKNLATKVYITDILSFYIDDRDSDRLFNRKLE